MGVWKNLYIPLLWGREGQTHSYVIFSKPIFYIRNRPVMWFDRIILHLRLEGKKVLGWAVFYLFYLFWFTSKWEFSVTDPFLTTFYYVEKRNGILRKNRGEEFEKSYISLHGGREEVKNCQNHPYVINEWHLSCDHLFLPNWWWVLLLYPHWNLACYVFLFHTLEKSACVCICHLFLHFRCLGPSLLQIEARVHLFSRPHWK